MATKDKLVTAGLWGGQADAIIGTTGSVAAAGTTQATATALTADITTITASATGDTGVLLRKISGTQVVFNADDADAALVYPPVGGTINGAAANASFSVAAGKTAMFMSANGVNFVALLGA